MNFLKHSPLGYSPIPDEHEVPQPNNFWVRIGRSCRRFLLALIFISALFTGIVIGATAFSSGSSCEGRTLQNSASKPPSAEDMSFRFLTRTFHYNRTFGADPMENNSTNDAWESIVPLGQGSVRLAGSPQIYTLSVIHQLHCLWSIHQSFYTALHADGAGIDEDNFPHIRHCFDYIRQALTCAADTTLEPVDPVLGGVTGWKGIHVCRDFSDLVAWSEDHRVNNLRGFREAHEEHSHHSS